MPDSIQFTLTRNDQSILLRLYASGAIHWQQGRTLFITDPHFGKADSFRHAGIAIPTAVLDYDLQRIDQLLAQSRATALVVLGDFFHTRDSQSDYTLAALEQWRARHPDLTITIVQGNHDRHAGPPPEYLDIATVEPPHKVGPFICHHLPQETSIQASVTRDGYILAGHLHPYIALHDRDGSSLRLASFIFGHHQAILPAFGRFTGGSTYAPAPGDRVFAIAQNEVLEIPTTRARRTTHTTG